MAYTLEFRSNIDGSLLEWDGRRFTFEGVIAEMRERLRMSRLGAPFGSAHFSIEPGMESRALSQIREMERTFRLSGKVPVAGGAYMRVTCD